MSAIISGDSPSITFSDATTQASAGLPKVNPTISSGVLTYPDATTQASSSGVAKAWVSYKGTTTRAINASYNVSSVTFNSTGNYTVNLTNALTDANYCACLGGQRTNASFAVSLTSLSINTNSSSCTLFTCDSAGTASDWYMINCSIFR